MSTLVVLRALGLGDFLTGVPAYRALARAFPQHRRVLAAPRVLEPLAERCAAFDAIVDVQPLQPLPLELYGADIAVNLHGRGPQSTRLLLDSEPRRLLAFGCDALPSDGAYPQWRPAEYEVQRWCRMLAAFGIQADPEDLDLAIEPDESARDIVLLHPGAAAPARRWPEVRWAELARRLTAAGTPLRITGSAAERDVACRIAAEAGLPHDVVLAGKTTLPGLASLIAGARALICGDTGVAHLATAVGTPSVVLFGPIPPAEWGPPRSRSERHRAIWHGRRGDPHGLTLDDGLASIGVEEVLAELLVALSEAPLVSP